MSKRKTSPHLIAIRAIIKTFRENDSSRAYTNDTKAKGFRVKLYGFSTFRTPGLEQALREYCKENNASYTVMLGTSSYNLDSVVMYFK